MAERSNIEWTDATFNEQAPSRRPSREDEQHRAGQCGALGAGTERRHMNADERRAELFARPVAALAALRALLDGIADGPGAGSSRGTEALMDVVSAGRLLVLALATLIMGGARALAQLAALRPDRALWQCGAAVAVAAGLVLWAAIDVIWILTAAFVLYVATH